MSARKTEAGPIPQDPSSGEPTSDPAPTMPVAAGKTGSDRPNARGLDPFETFTEWAGPIDEADYADL